MIKKKPMPGKPTGRSAVNRVATAASYLPGAAGLAGAALSKLTAGKPPTTAVRVGTGRKRRSRAVFMRKGRVFVGYSAKEVKTALRRKGGGARPAPVVIRR